MKVLIFADYQQDFLAFCTWRGLGEVLGFENVITYPYVKHYRGGTDNSYILPDGKPGFTSAPHYVVPIQDKEYSEKEIKDMIKDFSFAIFYPRDYSLKALRKFRTELNLPPLVFIDGEDYEYIHHELIEEFKPRIVFKRELTHPISDVFPLPFSAVTASFPQFNDQEKIYNISAIFGNTHPLRKALIEKLSSFKIKDSYLGVDSETYPWGDDRRFQVKPLLPYHQYLEVIAKSKITFVIRGWGRTTLRQWEAYAYETCVFENDCGVIIPFPFLDDVHRVSFSEDFEGLQEKIEYYLEHEEKRKRIARAGKEHLYRYHSTAKRAEYLLDIVKKRL